MPYVALKDVEFRRVKFPAGSALPKAVGRWVDLRHMQRKGCVSRRGDAQPFVVDAAPAATTTPVLVELASPPSSAVEPDLTVKRGPQQRRPGR